MGYTIFTERACAWRPFLASQSFWGNLSRRWLLQIPMFIAGFPSCSDFTEDLCNCGPHFCFFGGGGGGGGALFSFFWGQGGGCFPFPRGGFQKGWFWRMFPRNENRNEGTFGCSSPGTRTRTRVRSHVPPERKTGTRAH